MRINNQNEEAFIRKAEQYLKETDCYKRIEELSPDDNYEVAYVMVRNNPEQADTKLIAFVSAEGDMAYFCISKKEKRLHVLPSYSFDEYLFSLLEKNGRIAAMTEDTHYNIWLSVEENYDEIIHKEGFQKYLDYCKDKKITKEFLGFSGLDIMEMYYNKVFEV